MEQKFYPDNFEQLLKETTDNFRMYPSKRVWHSIYNDLHPSRRWPSLAIWLLLISSIVFIGLSNKNQVGNSNNPNVANSRQLKNTSQTNITSNTESVNNSGKHLNETAQPVTQLTSSLNNTGTDKILLSINQPLVQQNKTGLSTKKLLNKANTNTKDIYIDLNNSSFKAADADKKNSIAIAAITPENKISAENDQPLYTLPALTTDRKTDLAQLNKDADLVTKKLPTETEKLKAAENMAKIADKAWIEDYAFHNKPGLSKFRSRSAYQIYFTPSVGYRMLTKNTNYNPVYSALMSPAVATQDYKKVLSQAAAINIELGGNILYSIAKNWNLKAGVQFNYTNYAINVYELKHPTMTTLLLNDLNNGLPSLDPRSTTLANISGVSNKKLNNNTYQVSLPLGADIKIAGKNNLKWYAGATIQPSYIIGGNAYLISSDLKNYVADNSLIRKWNLNTAVETFISYQTKGGIIINAGPQLRYQVMSTYSKQYTYDEKLYNIGLKIGITTKF